MKLITTRMIRSAEKRINNLDNLRDEDPTDYDNQNKALLEAQKLAVIVAGVRGRVKRINESGRPKSIQRHRCRFSKESGL